MLIPIVVAILLAPSCARAEVLWYTEQATPEEQAAVDPHIPGIIAQRQAAVKRAEDIAAWGAAYDAQMASSSPDCYTAIDRHWPGDKARMRQIVWRESRNQPAAQNSSSSAAGCAQMLALHAHRFAAVGCSWAMRYDADCNIKAAAHLYRAAGWSPWNV